MAAPIRPPVWPPAQTDLKPGRNDTRMSAQKAFFEAALAGKPSPVAHATTQRAAPSASPAQAAPSFAATGARAADRLPPPGSILNILV